MTMEQFHFLWFLVLSCRVPIPNLQEVLATDPEPCDADQKYLFAPISAPPSYQPEVFNLEHKVLMPQSLGEWNQDHATYL